MDWIWGNGLPTGIPEPVGYGDGYLFSYPIGYRVGFGYRVLSSGLGMGSILPDPNPTHCHPYVQQALLEPCMLQAACLGL